MHPTQRTPDGDLRVEIGLPVEMEIYRSARMEMKVECPGLVKCSGPRCKEKYFCKMKSSPIKESTIKITE